MTDQQDRLHRLACIEQVQHLNRILIRAYVITRDEFWNGQVHIDNVSGLLRSHIGTDKRLLRSDTQIQHALRKPGYLCFARDGQLPLSIPLFL